MNGSVNVKDTRAPNMVVSLSAAAVTRLTQTPRFSVDLTHCTVTLVINGTATAVAASTTNAAKRPVKKIMRRQDSELYKVFNGLDVL
jgi:hypothetical protein